MSKPLYRTILFGLVVLCFLALPGLLLSSQTPPAPSDMMLASPDEGAATKPPVLFSHAKHSGLDCTSCHHKYSGSGPVAGCSSQGCHTDLASKKGDSSFYAAFHAKSEQSCLGCHKALSKAGNPAGPTKCTECHIKGQALPETTDADDEFKEEEVTGAAPSTSREMNKHVAAGMMTDGAFMAPPPPDPMLQNLTPEEREQYLKIDQNPVKRVNETPVSTFSVDVDTGAYANVRRFLNSGALPQKDAVRVEEMINYFSYDYAQPKDREAPFKVTTEIAPTPWNKDTLLLSVGIKGYEIERSERPAANLVFLLDVSGSMNDPDKLPLLKSAFTLLTKQLTEKDRVSIVVYAGAAGVVLEPTPGNEAATILAALQQLEAGGSTAGGEGIKLAYAMARQAFIKDGINRILLATDGDFNVGLTDFEALLDMIERERRDGVSLTTLGFGTGNYNEQLMEQAADKGNGNYSYIDTLNEANKVLVSELSSTLFTIAKDVKIQIEFNPAVVAEYRLIGYENRLLKEEDFDNDKIDAGEIGAGHTVTALYEIALVGSDGMRLPEHRYDQPSAQPTAEEGSEFADELCFLKLRYKMPDSDKSTLMETPLGKDMILESATKASDNFRWAAAVAAFGELLRDAAYTGDYTYDDVLELARTARGEDPFGYRAEFLKLVSLAQGLDVGEGK